MLRTAHEVDVPYSVADVCVWQMQRVPDLELLDVTLPVTSKARTAYLDLKKGSFPRVSRPCSFARKEVTHGPLRCAVVDSQVALM